MSDSTKIQWADATLNVTTGCSKVTSGCDFCYAERMSNRLQTTPKYDGTILQGKWSGQVLLHPETIDEPIHWKKPRRIFVCSMSDLFHRQVPWEFICRVFEMMAWAHWHTFLLLTKRPGRMAYFAEEIWPKQTQGVPLAGLSGPQRWPDNVWAGCSISTRRYLPWLDVLARVDAPVRFVSFEPLLEDLGDLREWLTCKRCIGTWNIYRLLSFPKGELCHSCRGSGKNISWVIAGGESGPHARPMGLEWARSIRDQCIVTETPFFLKQLGGRHEMRAGASAILDGELWTEFPKDRIN